MAKPQLILPRADSGCGRAFYDNRRAAEWHRVALEFWNQATGRTRAGYRLAVYRCRRCGGFHVGEKRIGNRPAPAQPRDRMVEEGQDWFFEHDWHDEAERDDFELDSRSNP